MADKTGCARKRAEQELLGLVKELTRRTHGGELQWVISPEHDSLAWLAMSNRRTLYVGRLSQTIALCVDDVGSAVVQTQGKVKPFIALVRAIEEQLERRSAPSREEKPAMTRDVEEILKRLKAALA